MEQEPSQTEERTVEDEIQIGNRGDFGLWAIEVAKKIVADQGFELARAARDGSEDHVRAAGNALGQATTNAMMEVFDGLMEGAPDDQPGGLKRNASAGRSRSRLPRRGAMLSLLRLRYLRPWRVENSRNPGRVAVAMLISPMFYIVFPGSRPDAG